MVVKKKAQMKLSFGMIFSIILIIIFLSFSFFAIKKFLDISSSAQISKFTVSLQNDIDKVWKGTKSSQEKEYILPKKIERVCFIDYNSEKTGQQYSEEYDELEFEYQGYENLFFYPISAARGIISLEMNNIDLAKMTLNENPFCIENKEGKIKIVIKKDYEDTKVTITE